MKRSETAAFLVGLVVLGEIVGYGSTAFKVGALGLAVAVLLASPLFWKWWWQPRYVLTPDELVVETRRGRRVIPLEAIAPAYDLPFLYRIDGRETPLPVSDAFLDAWKSSLPAAAIGGARGENRCSFVPRGARWTWPPFATMFGPFAACSRPRWRSWPS